MGRNNEDLYVSLTDTPDIDAKKAEIFKEKYTKFRRKLALLVGICGYSWIISIILCIIQLFVFPREQIYLKYIALGWQLVILFLGILFVIKLLIVMAQYSHRIANKVKIMYLVSVVYTICSLLTIGYYMWITLKLHSSDARYFGYFVAFLQFSILFALLVSLIVWTCYISTHTKRLYLIEEVNRSTIEKQCHSKKHTHHQLQNFKYQIYLNVACPLLLFLFGLFSRIINFCWKKGKKLNKLFLINTFDALS